MASIATLIPADLAESIERQTGATIAAVVPRGGGGASRLGAEVTLDYGDGTCVEAYLSYDPRADDPRRMPFFTREVAILSALSGPLANSGVKVPRFIAAEPAHLALLCAKVAGADRFDKAGDAAALVGDFAQQLAALHAIDPAVTPLDGFGDPATPVSQRISETVDRLLAEHLAAWPDPVIILALNWLKANIPVDAGVPVIVHGDAGTGNFLHADDCVTALLDWELTHYGDPAEDLAGAWVRALFQPFVPMQMLFDAYAAASGRAVDVARVKYFRLYFQMGFMVAGHAAIHAGTGPRQALPGISMVFHTAHMRVIVESLAEMSGQVLIDAVVPDAPVTGVDRTFAFALDDIAEAIVPRLSDQQAAAKAKSLARLVKYWRNRERYGAVFDAAERASVGATLGRGFASAAEARSALAHALLADSVDPAVALQLCHERMQRDTFLMADAMGSLATCHFPPL